MVLIAGAGAVGTILAAYLALARRPTRLLIRAGDVAQFQNAPDLRVDRVGGGPPLIVHKPHLTTALDPAGVDYLFICVKFPDLDGLLDALPSSLPRGLTLVSTLSGVGGIRRIRERFPANPAAAMSVMFNGQLLEPLHARITTRPHVLLGSDDSRLLELFGDCGMQVTRVQGEASAWGKLLINLSNAICALTHTTFKDLLTVPELRAAYAAVLDEAVGALQRAGIRFQLPVPLAYGAYRQLLLRGGPAIWWLAKLKSGLQDCSFPSMVADVYAGRRTEVDQLNGEIVSLGREYNIPTPLNARLVSLVQAIEGRMPPPRMSAQELRRHLGV